MKQKDMILEYMRDHGSITQKEAYMLGCTRLAARVADLKAAGHCIISERVQVTRKDGSKTSIAAYRLET